MINNNFRIVNCIYNLYIIKNKMSKSVINYFSHNGRVTWGYFITIKCLLNVMGAFEVLIFRAGLAGNGPDHHGHPGGMTGNPGGIEFYGHR